MNQVDTLEDRNQVSLNKSEKFQDAVNDMRLSIWKKFLSGVANNPNMTKKEICYHLGLKVGTINSIQQHYKLQSPFYYKKPKIHTKISIKSKKKINNNAQETVKGKKKKTDDVTAKGGDYDFEETFNNTVKSLETLSVGCDPVQIPK